MSGLLNSDNDCQLMALCYEYVRAIKNIEKSTMQGIYGLDKYRTKLHDQILELTGLAREDLYDVTTNIDKYKSPQDLFVAILDICSRTLPDGW